MKGKTAKTKPYMMKGKTVNKITLYDEGKNGKKHNPI